ncbi:tyrosine-type recombinase/integrase [Paraburkholderia nodosa]|uniref:tyrosine-type recombinase/integrase n=1 Tax=Paraburkholderia nodosa TaxID=392320 RepID=UPI0004B92D0F|nr:site-specific integrase [Paraburkholderia nodosa]
MPASTPKSASLSRTTAYNVSPIRPNTAARRAISFSELADAYLATYAGRDPSRGQGVARWCQYFDGWLAHEIDADAVADALDHWASTPVRRFMGYDKETGEPRYKELDVPAPATVAKAKAVVSAVLTFGRDRRMMPKGWTNPARDVALPSFDNARTRFLSDAERERLLAVCRVSTWDRLYLLALMGLTCGARHGELMRLRYRDIDLDAGTAYLATSKNDEPRVLVLTPAVVSEIRSLGKPAHPDALLFARVGRPDVPFTTNSAWAAALVDARIENFRFHDLRHSCASMLAQNGASLLDIADTLGHKDMSMVKRYAHLCIDSKRATINRVMANVG